MDNIKEAITCILEGNLELMREHINTELSIRAAEKLEEKKIEIADTYFGQK